jgi:UDP-glucose 4-epimerase
MSKKHLIIGGAGFIGSNLAEELLKEQDTSVVIADDLSLGTMENIDALLKDSRVRFEKIDFSVEADVHSFFEKGSDYDTIFHLAANSDIQKSAKDPKIEYKNTFMTTLNTVHAAKDFGIKKLVFSSTSAIYGDQGFTLITEDMGNLAPISYYGGAKLASEAFINSYSFMNDIQVWIYRFPNVIGDNATHGVIYDFVNRLVDDSSKLVVLGDGKQAKPYLYVKDLVEAMVFAWKNSSDRINTFNIGVETQTSVANIAKIVLEEMELNSTPIEYTGGKGGWKGDIPVFKYDISKINALGWKAKYSSDDAVRKATKIIIEAARSK